MVNINRLHYVYLSTELLKRMIIFTKLTIVIKIYSKSISIKI